MWIVRAILAAIVLFGIIGVSDLAAKAIRKYKRVDTRFQGFNSAWSKLKQKGYRLESDSLGGWYIVNGRGELATNEVLYTDIDTASGKLEVFAKLELERLNGGTKDIGKS